MKTTSALLILGLLLAGCGNSPAPAVQTTAVAKPPDEAATLTAISKITEAQSTYFKINRRYALSFDELVEAHLLDAEPPASQTGYEFKLRPAADAQTFKLFVTPVLASPTDRRFFTDQSGVIHADSGKDATADSPALAK